MIFTTKDIKNRVRGSPFLPLRIVTSSGESYDVRHPDLIMVGRRDLTIGIASREDPSTYEQVARVPIFHITAIEDLPKSARSRKNGDS